MKKSILFSVIFGLIGLTAFGQQSLVKASGNFQGFADQIIGGTYTGFGLGLESRMGKKFTVGLDAQFFRKSNDIGDTGFDEIREIINFQPEARFYPSEAFRGFYVGAHSTINLFNYKIKSDEDSVENPEKPGPDTAIGLGFTLGAMAPLTDRLQFGISAGGDYIFNPGGRGSGSKFLFGMQLGYSIN